MKYPTFLLLVLALVACNTVPAPSPAGLSFRPEVLYFENNAAGQKAAAEVAERFGGRQETILIDEKVTFGSAPVPISRPPPLYPYAMRRQNIQGGVEVEFIIDERGKVFDAVAITSTNPVFIPEAVAAVKKWTFKPAMRDRVGIRCRLRVTVAFSLSNN